MSITAESEFAIDNYRLVQEVIGGPITYSKESNVDMGDASGKRDKTERTTYIDDRKAAFRLMLPEALQASDRVITSIRFDIKVLASDTAILYATTQHVENMTPEAAWAQLDADGRGDNWLYITGSINDTVTDPYKTEQTATYGCFFDTQRGDVTANTWQAINYIAKSQAHFYITGYSSKTPAQIDITSPTNMANQIGDEDITLEWTFSHELNTVTQYSYGVEYSTDEGLTWTELAHTVSSSNSYTIPANTLSGGKAKLRLTAYTWDSDEQAEIATNTVVRTIIVRYNPATSDVSCDGLPHPTVSWTSVDQTAYQVRFDTWDSGAIIGDATSLTVPRVFGNGVYPVTVRTQTSNGEWSAWSETVWVEVANNDAGMTTTLTVTQSAAAALCSWTAVAGSVGYILLRDGEPIYAGTTLYFRDNAVTGTAAYTVRVLAASGYYTDNGPVTFALALRCDMMLPLDDDTAEWIPLRYSLAPRSRSYDRSAGVTMRYYAGREKPIAVSNGTSALTMRTTCAFKRRADAEALMMMTGRPVLYKDYNGGKIIGIINPVGYDSERVYSVDISVTEIDWPDNLDAEIAALYAAVADTIRAVNPVTQTRVQALITSTGSWGNASAAGRAWMLAVPAGSEKLRLTAVKTANFVAYLTSATVATSGTPAYATGESGRHEVSVGQNLLTLPSDCTYVYVAIRNTSGWIIPKNAQFEGDYAVQSE